MDITIRKGFIFVDGKIARPDWSSDMLVIPAVTEKVRVEERVTGHYGADSWDTGRTEVVCREQVVVPETRVPIPEQYGLRQFPFQVRLGNIVSLKSGKTTEFAVDSEGEAVAFWSEIWQCWRTPRQDGRLWEFFDKASFVPDDGKFAFLESEQRKLFMARKQGMTIMP